jgi:hypothetical protein
LKYEKYFIRKTELKPVKKKEEGFLLSLTEFLMINVNDASMEIIYSNTI